MTWEDLSSTNLAGMRSLNAFAGWSVSAALLALELHLVYVITCTLLTRMSSSPLYNLHVDQVQIHNTKSWFCFKKVDLGSVPLEHFKAALRHGKGK